MPGRVYILCSCSQNLSIQREKRLYTSVRKRISCNILTCLQLLGKLQTVNVFMRNLPQILFLLCSGPLPVFTAASGDALRPLLTKIAVMCLSHTFFTRRNVIFGCHFLVSKIQPKFLTITPTFIWGANRVQRVLGAIYPDAKHFHCRVHIWDFLLYFLRFILKGRKQHILWWLFCTNMYTTTGQTPTTM